MATLSSADPDAEAWTLTLDEYKQTPQTRSVPPDSVLAVNIDDETFESMRRFSGKELSTLALIMDARRSGKKATVIQSIFERYTVRKVLDDHTVESLQSLKVVKINALLKSAGLPASYGNKETKSLKLIAWRDRMRKPERDLLALAKHFLKVVAAIAEKRFHLAVANSEMTISRASEIIKSAGFSVPSDLGEPVTEEPKRKGGRPTRALEDREIPSMFAKIDGRYAERTPAMLMCGIHMALRASELCGLTVGDVSDGQNVRQYITVRSEIAKGSKQRFIRIGDEVQRVISDFLQWKRWHGESIEPSAPLFVSQKGGHLSRKRLFVTVKELLQRAGIDQSPHCLRKTGATIYYEQSGYDLIATQVFLGHADPSVTRRYIGITPTQTADYAQRSSKALVSAVETGKSEGGSTGAKVSDLSSDDHQRLIEELERRGRTIETLTTQVDRLTRILERQDADISAEQQVATGGGKVVMIDLARRRKRKEP